MRFSTKQYFKHRYRDNPVYRKSQIAAVLAWQARNPKKVKQYRKNQNIAYANRTPSEIKKRKQYLIKLRSKKK